MPTKETEPTSIYVALMKAQNEMGPVLKNATNPHLKSKYADLGSVIETITEPLHNNGLVFTQLIQSSPDGAELVTVIALAATGDKLESRAPIVSKDPSNPQAFGAALTYMRRYSLLAMCGLSPEDDDGHAATKAPAQRQPKDEPQPAQTRTTAPRTNAPAANGLMALPQFEMAFTAALVNRHADELRRLMEGASDSIPHWVTMVNVTSDAGQLHWVKSKMNELKIPGATAFDEAFAAREEDFR